MYGCAKTLNGNNVTMLRVTELVPNHLQKNQQENHEICRLYIYTGKPQYSIL